MMNPDRAAWVDCSRPVTEARAERAVAETNPDDVPHPYGSKGNMMAYDAFVSSPTWFLTGQIQGHAFQMA